MVDNELAPIALFVYKRLWHSQQTVTSLQKNALANQSILVIYSDGAKEAGVEAEVMAVRNWLPEIKGFKEVHIIEQPHNLGLANAIIAGVTELTQRFGKVIVVEDDLVVSPYFLQYMNEGLVLYEHDEIVASIHGYALPITEPMPTTYFLRGADCWGWATWQRAWGKFEPEGKKLLTLLKLQGWLHEFDYQSTQKYGQMLKDQILQKNNSWAIRWYASAFIHQMLTLYPGKSLVQNIGMDNSGEHCVATTTHDVELVQEPILVERLPLQKNDAAFQAYVRFFKSIKEPMLKKIARKCRKLLGTVV